MQADILSTEQKLSPEERTEWGLLSFMIGPVQPFIESARTLRDLWSGSYLLSWLTASAMIPIIDEPKCGYDAFVTPHVDVSNPILAVLTGRRDPGFSATLPSLPNKFTALVRSELAEQLRSKCLKAVREEWGKICESVHAKLVVVHKSTGLKEFTDWDMNWKSQVEDFFEFRCVFHHARQELNDPVQWYDEWKTVGALMEMTRSIRHVPDYLPQPDSEGRFPPKCSLLGTFEQMGPAEFRDSKKYWKELHSPNWKGINGTRLQSSDRFCAISLVKRFAWPAYFAGPENGDRGRLGLDVRGLRFSDTATIAAANWLSDGKPLTPYSAKGSWNIRGWSGQWLHWPTPTGDEDETCPEPVWNAIQQKKKSQGAPPTYYAILHMDGDNMGQLFQGNSGPSEWGQGRLRYQGITRRLTLYSLEHVQRIVEDFMGELIYAGGDDVLAILPASTTIACARSLRNAFSSTELLGSTASSSAGIAVVHYKEDLRFALDVARKSEKAAKSIGKSSINQSPVKKDALAITVCRHSGEHSTCVMGWDQTEFLNQMIAEYRESKPPSDRWSYKLREEFSSLRGLPAPAIRAELSRLLKRTESASALFRERVESLFDSFQLEMCHADRNWTQERVLDEFTLLCQTASFLARGKE